MSDKKQSALKTTAKMVGAAFTASSTMIRKVVKNFYKRKHISGTARTEEVDENFLTEEGKKVGVKIKDTKVKARSPLKLTAIDSGITDEAKKIISETEAKIREGKQGLSDDMIAENIAGSLINYLPFLNSVSNIFYPSFLGLTESKTEKEPEIKMTLEQEAQKQEAQKQEAQKQDMKGETEKEPEKDPEIKMTLEQERQQQIQQQQQGIFTLPRNFSMLDSLLPSPTPSQATLDKISVKVSRRSNLPTARQLLLESRQGQEKILKGQEQLLSQVQEIQLSSSEILERFKRAPMYDDIRKKIEQKITKKQEYKGLGLDQDVLNNLINTIPSENRSLLGSAIRGLNQQNIDYNTVLSGIVGLVASATISPVAGPLISSLTQNILSSYGVNIGDLLSTNRQTQLLTEGDDDLEQASTDEELENFNGQIDSDMSMTRSQKIKKKLLALYKYIRKNIKLPTDAQIRQGITTGALASSAMAGLSSGSAMGAVSGLIPGAVGGATASLVAPTVQRITAPMVEEFLKNNGVTIDDNLRRKINYVSLLAPPALVGGYIGYTPQGQEVMGTGVVSGSGITERKLIASPEVIQQTKVQEEQRPSGNKIWQPKSISPTTDILDVPKQEMYADDMEFIAFNYIAPTSEGAAGTVETNPLKRSQATADAIRFTDAGVYIPYLLWNKINDTNDMNEQTLKKLALGVELPPMDFIEQDNETTFEEVARVQFPNGENTEIEFLSPYSDFSNVDNFWMINQNNILFTINP